MTDTEATAKKAISPERKEQNKTTRLLARSMARLDHDGTREEFAAKWEESKTEYLAEAKKLTKALAREGVTLVPGPKPERKGKKADA